MHGLAHSKNKHNLMYGGWIPDALPAEDRRPVLRQAQAAGRTAAQRKAYERRTAARARSEG